MAYNETNALRGRKLDSDYHEPVRHLLPVVEAPICTVRRFESLTSLKKRGAKLKSSEALALHDFTQPQRMPSDRGVAKPHLPLTQHRTRKSKAPRSGSFSGKENVPMHPIEHPRRRPLSNVTNTTGSSRSQLQRLSILMDPMVSPQEVVKVDHSADLETGLRIKINGRPFVSPEEQSIDYPDQFADTSNNFLPPFGSTPLRAVNFEGGKTTSSNALFPSTSLRSVLGLGSVNTTPLREAIAAFSDIFSSGGSQRSAQLENSVPSTPVDEIKSSFRPSFSMPSLRSPLKLSHLTESVSHLTSELVLSVGAQADQYDEAAVSHNETFGWESEMRSLELQCHGVSR